MKTTPSLLIAAMATEVTTIAGCWLVKRTDGTVLGFTDHQVDLAIDTVTYQAASGFSRTALSHSSGLSVDNLDLLGVLDSAAITEQDLRGGVYRDAQVWYFEVDYTNTALGTHKLDYGFLGEVTVQEGVFVAEFRSLMQRLDQEIGEKAGRYCRVPLGAAFCGIELEPDDWVADTEYALGDIANATVYDGRRYVVTAIAGDEKSGLTEPTWDTTVTNTTVDDQVTWTCFDAWTKEGSVTSFTDNRQFADTTMTQADDWFKFGVVTFDSGLNSGLSMDVKQSTSAGGLIELRHPFPFDIAVTDTYRISAGCNHLLKMPVDSVGSAYTGDCRAKFSNVVNFQGEPEIPGPDSMFS